MSKITEITRTNCQAFLAAFIEENKLKVRNVAKAITCSEITLERIIAGKTVPSDEMIRQTGIMIELGFKSYSKLSKAEKEKISETIGAIGGGVLGFGGVTAAVSSLGIAGLSAAGITSGLSVLGGIVGGGMAAGIGVCAAIPIAVGAVGYALIKGIKALIDKQKLDDDRYDPFWERPIDEKN